MSKAPFPITPALTAIAIAYRNDNYIADSVLPYVPVSKQEFEWLLYNFGENYTIPQTLVGRKSKPNEVEFSATKMTSSCEDYALDAPVPQRDIDNAPDNYDPEGRAAEGVMDLIKLDREKRTADLVFNAATYPTDNKQTLSGNSQFSDFVNSDPVGVLSNALEVPRLRPNAMVIGSQAWSILRRHPKLVKAIYPSSAAGDGQVSREQFADFFEIKKLYVGASLVNSAKKGQTTSLTRIWGKNIALIYQNQLADTQGTVTFGMTARFGTPVAGRIEDKDIGMRGGFRVRAGESVKELIVAPEVGYFLQNVAA
jgi:hypothetical protein